MDDKPAELGTLELFKIVWAAGMSIGDGWGRDAGGEDGGKEAVSVPGVSKGTEAGLGDPGGRLPDPLCTETPSASCTRTVGWPFPCPGTSTAPDGEVVALPLVSAPTPSCVLASEPSFSFPFRLFFLFDEGELPIV